MIRNTTTGRPAVFARFRRRLRPTIFGAILCCLTALNAAADTLGPVEKQTLLGEGEDFFRQGNELLAKDPVAAKAAYAKAALRWERLIREGRTHNGGLYYNLGNAYFRVNDLGRAILAYRRAERYLPLDVNLRQNLEYARAKRLDRVDERPQDQAWRTIFFWHYDLAAVTRATIFMAGWLLFWGLAGWRRLGGQPPRWLLGLIGGLTLLFLGSVLLTWQDERRHPDGVVLSVEITARKGDGEGYDPSFKEPLHAGTEFRLIEQRSDWRQVELRDGRRCWLPNQAGELL